jgi:hypothetical protein
MIVLILLIPQVSFQAEIFYPKAKILEESYLRIRDQLAEAESNVVIKVSYGTLNPFYLHSVEKLLYSDPKVVGKGILLVTDWHKQWRQNTRFVNSLNKPTVNYTLGTDKDGVLHFERSSP